VKKRLVLKSEHLSDLSEVELGLVNGGTYTGNPGCVLSIKAPCVTNMFCTVVNCINTFGE
jgi:hypothetical protein